jgi:hypothetical protein
MHHLAFALLTLALACCSLEPVFAQERVDPDWPALLLLDPCEGGTLTLGGPRLDRGRPGIVSGLRAGDCVRLRREGDALGAVTYCSAATGTRATSPWTVDVQALAALGLDVSGYGCPVDAAGKPVAAASFAR